MPASSHERCRLREVIEKNVWSYCKIIATAVAKVTRVLYHRWVKEVKTHFFTALASIWSNIFINSNEKMTCLLLCLLRIFKFQTLTCQNFWIFYFTSRLTLYECVVNICIQRWFLIRNWTIADRSPVAVYFFLPQPLPKPINTSGRSLLVSMQHF